MCRKGEEMNTEKLEGIVSAIEAESKSPAPSHNNLARLCGLFMRELISIVNSVSDTLPSPCVEVKTTSENEAKVEIDQEQPKKRGRKAKNSK